MKYIITTEEFWEKVESCLYELDSVFGTKFVIEPAIELLAVGAFQDNPELMYLWAEYLLWGSITGDEPYSTFTFREIFPEDCEVQQVADRKLERYEDYDDLPVLSPDENGCRWEAPEAYYWYKQSAQAGYVPAICWLAWCAKRGIAINPDEEESVDWISLADEYPKVPDLLPKELNVFAEKAIWLGELSCDADLEEDICMDRGERFSGPTWKELLRSSMNAYVLGCMMGSPRCALPHYEYQAYDYETCDSDERRRMCVEKRLWQIWCGINGIGVHKATPEQLQAWLTDVERAVDYGPYSYHLDLDENTEALICELTQAVSGAQPNS